jgi:hypothetical protein
MSMRPSHSRSTRRFRIRTVAGGGFAIPVGASITTFQIEDVISHDKRYYTLTCADFGFGTKAGGAGPSQWTVFTVNCSLEDFHGYVTLTSAVAAAGVGGSGLSMYFVTGPASGVRINGIGFGVGLGLSASATHGWMKLRKP